MPVAVRARLLHILPKPMVGDFNSLQGQLLLDGGRLRDSFFHRSVVLLCRHNADGAFGLILNRPAECTVGDVLVADVADSLKGAQLHLGGPVQTNALSFLHSEAFLPDGNVMENLSLGHDLDDLMELADSFDPGRRLRCFAGYAGWSGGQLEGELQRDAWVVHPAKLEHVFTANPGSLWRDVLREKGGLFRLIADAPEDNAHN